ncbi:rCG50922 [Rattus norvegicus]|uniref:RCG50922 n=1 Tax=Rattus norvegicus TaxID=10116 RepID=A6KJ38_RAT|nr:rCG50922 [Rattus norvegicus]
MSMRKYVLVKAAQKHRGIFRKTLEGIH